MSECYKAIRKVSRNITSHLQKNEKEKEWSISDLYYAKYDFLTQVFIWLCNHWRIYTTYYKLRLLATPGEHLLISLFFKWRIGESHAVCKVLFRESSCKVGPEYSKPVREKLMQLATIKLWLCVVCSCFLLPANILLWLSQGGLF